MSKSSIVILLAIVVGALLFIWFASDNTEPGRIHISTTSEPDFDSSAANNPHTSEAGIAIVGAGNNSSDRDIRLTTNAQNVLEDPNLVWSESDNLTHNGFTVSAPLFDEESIGILTIPDIGLSVRVYEGEDEMAAMEKGVARFRHTSAWEGHIGLSAHNINLDGSPGHFLNIHTLTEGAVIRYETAFGVREYAVERIFSVDENSWSALSRTQENRISLVTCITGSPELRLVITGVEIA